jgi:hypothetical protein
VGEQASQKKPSRKFRKITELHKKVSVCILFFTKRTKVMKVALAIVALMFLAGAMSGLMLAQVMSASQTSSTLSNVGTLKVIGVGIYWDAGFTNKTTTIDWGLLEPGTQKSYTIYIRNEGNSPITLSKATSNWSPSTASTIMTLAWNYNGQTINAGASVQVTFTLTVATNTAGINTFSVDITIIGSG